MGSIKFKEPTDAMMKIASPSYNISRSSIGMENSICEYFYISIDNLIPFKYQGRKFFDQEELDKLAISIKQYGIRQPLSIVKSETYENKFEVVSGERRMRAAKIAGLEKVPCIIIKDYKNAESIAIIENIQRSNLHPVELATSYKSLIDNGKFESGAEIIESLGINKSSFYETMKILDLPEDIRDSLLEHNIVSRDKIRNIIKSADPRMALLKIISPSERSGYCRSILRVGIEYGDFYVQKEAVYKLKQRDKERLKEILENLIKEL